MLKIMDLRGQELIVGDLIAFTKSEYKKTGKPSIYVGHILGIETNEKTNICNLTVEFKDNVSGKTTLKYLLCEANNYSLETVVKIGEELVK